MPPSSRTVFRVHYYAMKTNHFKIVQRLLLLILVAALLAIVGVGCNTAHGFGKDMENAGEKIQDGTN